MFFSVLSLYSPAAPVEFETPDPDEGVCCTALRCRVGNSAHI